MKAIVLAAGEGTRLRPHTLNKPKCLVELAGASLLDHQLTALTAAGVEDIAIVTGYRAEQLTSLGYPTFHNPRFDQTNMVTSLMCARELFDGRDDLLIAYADIVYEPRVIHSLLASDAPLATTIDLDWQRLWEVRQEDPLIDAETLELDADQNIVELGKRPSSLEDIEGQYMGLIKIDRDFAPQMIAHYQQLDPLARYDGKDLDNLYMTSFLQSLIDSQYPLRAVLVEGGWIEVDSVGDLELYQRLFRNGALDSFCRLSTSTAPSSQQGTGLEA